MRLHIGGLYWPEVTSLPEIRLAKDAADLHKEILVVGGGISGAISAYRLAKAGHPVSLIEENTIASGSSAANTGLIQYMSDQGLDEFIDQIGKEKAVRFYDQSIEAVSTLVSINEDLDKLDEETFELRDSLILATEEDKIQTLKDEVEAQEDQDYAATYESTADLKEDDVDAYAGMRIEGDIALNPYGFVHQLIQKAIDEYDLKVLEHTRFVDLESSEEGHLVRLETEEGEEEAVFDRILFATGYNPLDFLKPYLTKLQVNKTYVTVSQKDISLDEEKDFLVWEMKDPYTYFRETFDGRLMVGGMDKEDDQLQEEDVRLHDDDLVEQTKDMIQLDDFKFEPEYSYAALFGESKDGIPYMGTVPGDDKLFVICAAGGNGTIYSTIGSEMALLWAKGEDLSDYDIYQLNR